MATIDVQLIQAFRRPARTFEAPVCVLVCRPNKRSPSPKVRDGPLRWGARGRAARKARTSRRRSLVSSVPISAITLSVQFTMDQRGGNFSVEHRELPGLSRTRPAFKQSGQPWTHRRSASGRAATGTNAANEPPTPAALQLEIVSRRATRIQSNEGVPAHTAGGSAGAQLTPPPGISLTRHRSHRLPPVQTVLKNAEPRCHRIVFE